MQNPLASIIVVNYNYAEYLGDAIKSALDQTYPNVEVIVVDDGSTDDSRKVIARYDRSIQTILKENGGQASGFNAGFAVSTGDIVVFLDSDDMLACDAIENAVTAFELYPDATKIQFRALIVDQHGNPTGEISPPLQYLLPSGDLRDRPATVQNYQRPTGGMIAFSRTALMKILPAPEVEYRQQVDDYIARGISMLGPFTSSDEQFSYYRMHGLNHSRRYQLDLDHIREYIRRTVAGHKYQLKNAEMVSFTGLPKSALNLIDLVLLWHRMISWKLEPQNHPLPKESVVRLCWLGYQATWTYRDISRKQQLMYLSWFTGMAIAPRTVAAKLTDMLLFPVSRNRLRFWTHLSD